jgi:methylated-DNA-[protein]-cysteine S-methyltransferase
MTMGSLGYTILTTAFGTLAVVWQESKTGQRVHQVLLPDEHTSAENLAEATFKGARLHSCAAIAALGGQIQRFLDGKAAEFDLDMIVLDRCSEFQQRVLLAEYGIPRGWVSTYGRIARRLGVPGAARAVGSALARNPFPIIIPCHRAVRANGELGGYQGGPKMKRALLELEGVDFSQSGRVLMDRVYY